MKKKRKSGDNFKDPKPIIEEQEPSPETPRTGGDANAIAARETRDRLMRDRVAAENEERRERESRPKKVIEFECEKLVMEILVRHEID